MTFEGALGKLNESYFFREFTFSSNTFKSDRRTELELADAVVWLDDLLIVVQVKERYAAFGATLADEENWFRNEVLGKAVAQVGNTLRYLQAYDSIELVNNQGHALNLADAKGKRTHKLVIYHTKEKLPDSCAAQKFHHADGSGIVHIFRSGDYLGILETLITPAEVHEYLSFRQEVIRRWPTEVSEVCEHALLGHFLHNRADIKPTQEYVRLLDAMRQKAGNSPEWDISRIIQLFAERRTTPQTAATDYYRTLKEIAKLNRTDMAQFKERFKLSMEMANADRVVLPYRFVASTGCGFLFLPLKRSRMAHRIDDLMAFTHLSKYDLKLERCVGLSFVSEGNGTWCDVQWCLVAHPCKEQPKYEEILKENYPFRPMKTAVVERYGLGPEIV